MSSLAELLVPELSHPVHPGDPDNPNAKPFPIHLGGLFGPFDIPEGMSQEDLEEAGIPTPELAKMFLEFVFHIIETRGGCSIVSTAELADLQAAAATREHKRVEIKQFYFACNQPAFRVTVRDFDTDHPIIPCQADEVQKAHTHG